MTSQEQSVATVKLAEFMGWKRAIGGLVEFENGIPDVCFWVDSRGTVWRGNWFTVRHENWLPFNPFKSTDDAMALLRRMKSRGITTVVGYRDKGWPVCSMSHPGYPDAFREVICCAALANLSENPNSSKS